MAQQLRAVFPLPESLGSITSIYIYIYGGPSPVPGDLILCSVFSGHRIHMQNTLTLKIK
jgi:hypothetical protein